MRCIRIGFLSISVVGLLCGMVVPVGGAPPVATLSAKDHSDSDNRTDRDNRIQIDLLVEQLADPDFVVRRHASIELKRLGSECKSALILALAHRDAEVRFTARVLLHSILQEDLEKRLAAFEADEQGAQSHEVPSWKYFSEVVGDDLASRKFYLEMVRAEPILFESLEMNAQRASATTLSRARALEASRVQATKTFQTTSRYSPYGNSQAIDLGNAAAIVLAASHPNVSVDDRISTLIHERFLSSGTLQRTLKDQGIYREPLRKLVGLWVRRSAGTRHAYQSLSLAMSHRLKDGLVLAAEVLSQEGAATHVRQLAIHAVGSLGTNDDVALLSPVLSDDSPVGSHSSRGNKKKNPQQMRDIALATMVVLSEQKPKDYFFTSSRSRVTRAQDWSFKTAANRTAALKKWDEWMADEKTRTQQASNEKASVE